MTTSNPPTTPPATAPVVLELMPKELSNSVGAFVVAVTAAARVVAGVAVVGSNCAALAGPFTLPLAAVVDGVLLAEVDVAVILAEAGSATAVVDLVAVKVV